MKKIVIFLTCNLYINIAVCQFITVPDANFKAKLLAANSGLNDIAANGSVGNWLLTTIDVNSNGEIEQSEADAITALSVYNSNIVDLTGIEHFTNLNYLNFSDNQVSAINFTTMPQLTIVYCGNNNLTSLDFSYNPVFRDLGCKDNPNLTTIKIKNGTMQLYGNQTIGQQCWTGLPNLNNICADVNEIPALQTYLTACGINTSGININSDCVLGNEEFASNELVVYPNPASSIVNIKYNGNNNYNQNIKTVELIDLQGRILVSKIVNGSNATLDVSGYSNGVYFIKVVGDGGSRMIKLVKE